MKQKDKEDIVLAYAAKITSARKGQVLNEVELAGETLEGEAVALFIDDSIEKGEDNRYPAGTVVYSNDPAEFTEDNPAIPHPDAVVIIDGEEYSIVDSAIAEASGDEEAAEGEAVDASAEILEKVRALLEADYVSNKQLQEALQPKDEANTKLMAENEALSNKVDTLNESAAASGKSINIAQPKKVSAKEARLKKFMKQ